MADTYIFTDEAGNCIVRIPGNCIYYSGNSEICGVSLPSGVSFNETVQRLVKCISSIVPKTTTTSTTSTTTSSTSSTTSTSTTSTSSTTSTTSSTTTTTTTLLTATIYWGAQSSSTPPNATQVQAQSSNTQNPSGNVTVNFTTFNTSPQYCWGAIPTAYLKSRWYDTDLNQGNIGGGGDLFTTFGTVTISTVSYTIYMTQYQTQFVENTQFRP